MIRRRFRPRRHAPRTWCAFRARLHRWIVHGGKPGAPAPRDLPLARLMGAKAIIERAAL